MAAGYGRGKQTLDSKMKCTTTTELVPCRSVCTGGHLGGSEKTTVPLTTRPLSSHTRDGQNNDYLDRKPLFISLKRCGCPSRGWCQCNVSRSPGKAASGAALARPDSVGRARHQAVSGRVAAGGRHKGRLCGVCVPAGSAHTGKK